MILYFFFLNGHIIIVIGTPDMVPSLPSTLCLYVTGGISYSLQRNLVSILCFSINHWND